MVPAAFEPFVTAAPFCVLTRAALESLFQPERLNQLFDDTARKQYTRALLFSQLVELMTAVVLRQQPSVRAAYRKGVGNISLPERNTPRTLARHSRRESTPRDSDQRLEITANWELTARAM